MKILRDFYTGINLGGILSLLGLIVSVSTLFLEGELLVTGLVYVFGTYILILAFFLVWREFVYSRKAKYAEACGGLHGAAHLLRDVHSALDEGNKNLVDEKIRDAIISFSNALSLVTGANCRCCIKTINSDTEKDGGEYVFVETLVRSETSESYDYDSKPAGIENNTDFYEILINDSNCFLSHDLTKESVYLNSHWPESPDKRKEFIKQRKYKYITTIVWPIKSYSNSQNKAEIIGFLCADSMTRYIFEARYDVDFGAIIADSLFPVLKRYRNSIKSGAFNT